MNILIVTPYEYNTSPPQRFRIEQWMPYLESQGVKCTFSPFMTPSLRKVLYSRGHFLVKSWQMITAFMKRLMTAHQGKSYDIIYLCREACLAGPAVAERIMAWTGVPIVYDFDDALFHRYISPFNSFFSLLKFSGKTATLCRIASHVIVGNRYLYEYATRHNKCVTIVPTTIDTVKYKLVEKIRSESPLVVGWTGSQSSTRYLPLLYPILQALSRRYPLMFLAVGARQFTIPGVKIEVKDWNPETEVEDLTRMDIGVMPLPDEGWAKGKCGLKLLQYMALGIPPVASPVGINTEIIQDGVNGFLASTEEEWVRKLSRLFQDRDLRQRMGLESRKTVEERYSSLSNDAEEKCPALRQLLHCFCDKL